MARAVPSLAELQQYNVNRPDQVEAIVSSLYDTQTLLSSSTQTTLTFFQNPLGGSANRQLDVTNMEGAGALPSPKSFLIETVEIFAYPGNVVTNDSTSITAARNLSDMYAFAKAGWLEIYIGSKAYLDEAPLNKFPPRSGLTGMAFLNDTTANTGTKIDYASLGGPVYELSPPILLVPTQNFKVTLNWSAAITLNANMSVMVNLGGILYRNSQ